MNLSKISEKNVNCGRPMLFLVNIIKLCCFCVPDLCKTSVKSVKELLCVSMIDTHYT